MIPDIRIDLDITIKDPSSILSDLATDIGCDHIIGILLHDLRGCIKSAIFFALNRDNIRFKRSSCHIPVKKTYDLVIGKEVMGKGLTNYDIRDRQFKFILEIEAPAETTVKRYMPARQNGATRADFTSDVSTGKMTIELLIKQGEFAMISGLPSGCSYKVTEVDNDADVQNGEPKTSDVFETYYAANDVEREGKKIIVTDTGKAELLEDQPARNVEMMERQGKYAHAVLSEGKSQAEAETLAKLFKDVATRGILRIEKKADATEAVNHVFFLNLRYDNVTTGVAMSVAPYAAMVVVAAVVGGAIYKRRKDDDDNDTDEI